MNSYGRVIRVLSLDGGGVRGLSSMIILEHLLQLTQDRLRLLDPAQPLDQLLPSELFDHIVGTSTGGLVAVMLVKLNMSISECIKTYKELIPRIFGKRQFGSCIGGLGIPRYSELTFRRCVQEVFDKHGRRGSEDVIRFMEEGNIGGNTCHCTVVCRELYPSGRRMNQPAFICSHYCRSTQTKTGKYLPYELWETCRATTAAPTFFPKITINNRTFVDGAFGNTNNPSRKAHFHFLSKVSGYKECPVIWLNIGTGSPKPQRDGYSTRSRRASIATIYKRSWRNRLMPRALLEAQNLLRDLEAIATDSDRVEEEMEDIINCKSSNQHITFARVSANNGVAEVQLDDWRSLHKIEQLTKTYLQHTEVQAKLASMADELANETIRRRKSSCRQVNNRPNIDPIHHTLPFLSAKPASSPLSSPAIAFSCPDHDTQRAPNLHSLSPLESNPISPSTKIETMDDLTRQLEDEKTEDTMALTHTCASPPLRVLHSPSQSKDCTLIDQKWKRRHTIY